VRDLGGKRPVYGYSSSPCVQDGKLYLDVGGTSGKSNACLDAASGKILWQTGDGEAGYATPFLIMRDGKEVLVMFKGQGFELREAADGELLARHAMETRDYCNCATPVTRGDTFLLSHTGGEGTRALQWDGADKLTEKWNERDLGLLFHSGVPVEARVLAFNDAVRGANDLRLIDLNTGKNVWQDTTVARGTAVASDDGHALLLTNTGELVLAKILQDKLDVLHRVQVLPAKSWVQPALADGRLICKNNDGAVVCLDLR
jgi:outer membrane protein assembly factor BamB